MPAVNHPPRPKPSPPEYSAVLDRKTLLVGALCGVLLTIGIYHAITIWIAEDRIAVGTIESLTASTELVSYNELAWSRLGQIKTNQRTNDAEARSHF
jgi:hypothetical protein